MDYRQLKVKHIYASMLTRQQDFGNHGLLSIQSFTYNMFGKKMCGKIFHVTRLCQILQWQSKINSQDQLTHITFLKRKVNPHVE